jgi:hypothetical protein
LPQPHAFSSREFLRALLVGKEVAYTITHTIDASAQKSAVGTASIIHTFHSPACSLDDRLMVLAAGPRVCFSAHRSCRAGSAPAGRRDPDRFCRLGQSEGRRWRGRRGCPVGAARNGNVFDAVADLEIVGWVQRRRKRGRTSVRRRRKQRRRTRGSGQSSLRTSVRQHQAQRLVLTQTATNRIVPDAC